MPLRKGQCLGALESNHSQCPLHLLLQHTQTFPRFQWKWGKSYTTPRITTHLLPVLIAPLVEDHKLPHNLGQRVSIASKLHQTGGSEDNQSQAVISFSPFKFDGSFHPPWKPGVSPFAKKTIPDL